MEKSHYFERYPKLTLLAVNVFLLAGLLVAIELVLRFAFGLGNPVLYDSNPIYGYRPLPHQETTRFSKSRLYFNNLGLRSDDEWDENIENKVLFIGNSVTYGGSYISNQELFTYYAMEGITDFMGGNAGVNGWGIENMYGLIVETEFLPARTYVTIVGKQDFYRGLTRLLGQPFWNRDPNFALIELLFHFYYVQGIKRYRNWRDFADGMLTSRVVEKAVLKLKAMDDFLKTRGYRHLIYISPSIDQLLEGVEKDAQILDYMIKHDLKPIYLLDRIKKLGIEKDEIRAWFQSDIHLNIEGHIIWGQMLNADLKKILGEIVK